MNENTLLSVRQLSVHYPILRRGFLIRREIGIVRACDEVSFDLKRGETIGIVGESGSGKTTLGRAILRAVLPTAGQVLFRSRQFDAPVDLVTASDAVLKKLRTEVQMIFQDPLGSLNPRMTIQQIVEEPLRIHQLAKGRELECQVVEMLRKVGIPPESRHRYPHAFSGGQRQRIGIARALVLRPALLVCDEAVSSLDLSVQAQIVNLLMDLQDEFGLSYLFIAHGLAVVRHMADRVALMRQGKMVGPTEAEQFFLARQRPETLGDFATDL